MQNNDHYAIPDYSTTAVNVPVYFWNKFLHLPVINLCWIIKQLAVTRYLTPANSKIPHSRQLPREWCIVISGRSASGGAGLRLLLLWRCVVMASGGIKARWRRRRRYVITVWWWDDACCMNTATTSTGTHRHSQPLTDTYNIIMPTWTKV